MGSVSAVEFVNYVPSIVVSENLTSYAAVDARIATDPDGIANLLYTYLNVAKPERTYAVNLTDKTKQELYKLDIDLLQSATNVGYPVPENGGEVKIRPFIQFSRLQSILTIVDSELQGVRDFETGRSVHLIDGSRFVKANITSVDVVAGTITVDVALVDATINIIGFVSVDPGRMVDVINFRDWVADEATVTSSTSLQGFNPDLYKLLYGEIDEDLVHMTDEELADNYLSNPSRIGSVSDLTRAVQSQSIVSTEVTNTLSLGPNAQILFDDGSSLLGMFGSGLVSDPKTTLETFNNLSVTPAALLAVITRELKDAFKNVSVTTLEASGDVAIVGDMDVRGATTLETVEVNTDAHILGNLIVDTDVTISGDTDLAGKVNVVGDLTATVVEASDVFVDGTLRTGGSVTVSGGAEVDGGLLVDTLTATDQIDARGGLDVAGDLDADILNVRNVATIPILFADTIQTSAMKSSILHSDSVEITADLTVSTVSGIDQSFSTADIARITAIDIITSNAQIEKARVMQLTTPIAEISSLETTDITASTVVVSDRIISHNEIISDTASFRSIHASNVVDTPSVMTQNLSTTNLDATSAKIHTLDSTDMKTSSFHTNTIDASGTIDAHTVRVSNTIDTPTISTRLATISELSVLDADVHRINVTDGATFNGPVESVNIRTDSILANDGTFSTLVTDSVSASNVITDRITSRKATLDSLETGSLATTALSSRAIEVETMDVVDVTCENIVTRELTSTAISSVVVKAESINSMDCRVASLVVDDLSGRNITVANDIVSHGNIHSQTLNVTSVQVGTLDGDRIGASEIHGVSMTSDRIHSQTLETDQISSQSSATRTLDVTGDARLGGVLDVSRELHVPVAHIQTCIVGDLNADQMHVNTVDVTDIRSVGVETINVHASTVVTDGLNANTVEAIDVHTQGITSNDIENSATIRTSDIHVSNSITSGTVDISGTLRCGVLTTDDSAVTIASGTFDAQAAYAKFGDTESTSLSTERLSTRDGDIINLRTANAIVNSIEAEEVSIPGTLSVDGASTFNGDISAEKMTIQHNTVQNMDVVQNTSLSGTVDFNMTDLTLPESVYCKSKLDVQEEISTTKLSGNTLIVSRIVIGPAGMTFV
jgi:cytoskeletal protein CcmA (bactofilin family)